MIRLHENFGGKRTEIDALVLTALVEKQLAAKRTKPSREAQELFYDALEAATDEREFELLQEGLRLDPGNIDVLLALLRHRPAALAEEIALLRKIVALAEKQLGVKGFQEFAGAFWGFMETRPYMRAREQLAESLRCAGKLEEAVAEWEGMLKLNPNDNQGMRYNLLASCLALNQMKRAAELFETYPECNLSTIFAWGRVLERWLSGDLAGAKASLRAARKQNSHTEAYLRGQKRVPKPLPDAFAIGSKEEAICSADILKIAWKAHPSARAWLQAQPPAPQRNAGLRRKNP